MTRWFMSEKCRNRFPRRSKPIWSDCFCDASRLSEELKPSRLMVIFYSWGRGAGGSIHHRWGVFRHLLSVGTLRAVQSNPSWHRLTDSEGVWTVRSRSAARRCWFTPHLGDLWDLVWVDGSAVLGHRHRVPGIISLSSLLSWIYNVNETSF